MTTTALTSQQREILDDITNLRTSRWVTVNGQPGTGKSFLLRALREVLILKGQDYRVLAPTNTAAKNVDGVTIYRYIGGGSALIDFITVLEKETELQELWKSNDVPDVARRVRKYIKDYATKHNLIFSLGSMIYRDRSSKTRGGKNPVIIIDETSMVSVPLFYCILNTLPSLKTSRIILFGDRNQLEPISDIKRNLYDLLEAATAFLPIIHLNLTENIRQKGSPHFQKYILDWWNENRLAEEVKDIKFGGTEEDFEKLPLPKIVLCGKRIDMRRSNLDELAKMPGNSIIREADVQNLENENDTIRVMKLSSLQLTLTLKENVPVILLKTTCSLFANSIYAFSQFRVINDEEYAILKDSKGEEYRVPRYREDIKQYNKETKHMDIFGYVVQYPIELFFAVTVNRVQGNTIEWPMLVKYETFWDETLKQAYVATSRVVSSELLYYDKNPLTIPFTLQKKTATQEIVNKIVENGKIRRGLV